MALSQIRDAIIYPLNPPPIPELGIASGFDMELEDQAGLGHAQLMAAKNQLLAMAATNHAIAQVQMQGLEDTPELKVDRGQNQGRRAGRFAGGFEYGPHHLFRLVLHQQLHQWQPRGPGHRPIGRALIGCCPRTSAKLMSAPAAAAMAPAFGNGDAPLDLCLAVVAAFQWLPRPSKSSAPPPPGVSIGQAMDDMQSLVKKLPKGIGYEWTGQSYQELLSAKQAPLLLALSILVVFLALSALYENWSIPIAVILVVPLGVFGALLGATCAACPTTCFSRSAC